MEGWGSGDEPEAATGWDVGTDEVSHDIVHYEGDLHEEDPNITGEGSVAFSFLEEMAEKRKRAQIWKDFLVAKPRMPTPEDATVDWSIKFYPKTRSELVENRGAVHAMERLLKNMEESGEVPNAIVYGSRGTGRTCVMEMLARDIMGEEHAVEKNYFRIDGHRDGLGINPEYWSKSGIGRRLEAWVDHMIDLKTKRNTPVLPEGKRRLLLFEGLDRLMPRVQMDLERILLKGAGYFKMLATCEHTKDKFLAKLEDHFTHPFVHLTHLSQNEFLMKVLSFCQHERIGFEKRGLEVIIDVCERSLQLAYEIIQNAFTRFQYISATNIRKLAPSTVSLPSVPINRVLRGPDDLTGKHIPLPRCPVCTLPLPCKHVDATQVMLLAKYRREVELPKGRGRAICPHWRRDGTCSNYTLYGRCLFDHPASLFKVEDFVLRCPVTTLPADASCMHEHPEIFFGDAEPSKVEEARMLAEAEEIAMRVDREAALESMSLQQKIKARAEHEREDAARAAKKKRKAEADKRRGEHARAALLSSLTGKPLPSSHPDAVRAKSAKGGRPGGSGNSKGGADRAGLKGHAQHGGDDKFEHSDDGDDGGHTHDAGEEAMDAQAEGARAPWFNSKRKILWSINHDPSLLSAE
jgi:hypothetical protein